MTLEKAIKILHPDTTLETLTEIAYHAGFNADEAKLDACNEACVVVCNAIKQQQAEIGNLKAQLESITKIKNGYYKDVCVYKKASDDLVDMKIKLLDELEQLKAQQPVKCEECEFEETCQRRIDKFSNGSYNYLEFCSDGEEKR